MGSTDSEGFLMASFPGSGKPASGQMEMKHSRSSTAEDRSHSRQGGHKHLVQERTRFFNLLNHPAKPANPQSREPEWGSKALFNIVMLYALPYLSWQGAPWLDEGCWKACPAFLIQPHSAKGVISQQCLISVLQTTRAVTEVDVFGFPWLVTGRCGLSAIIITCFGSHVCC